MYSAKLRRFDFGSPKFNNSTVKLSSENFSKLNVLIKAIQLKNRQTIRRDEV